MGRLKWVVLVFIFLLLVACGNNDDATTEGDNEGEQVDVETEDEIDENEVENEGIGNEEENETEENVEAANEDGEHSQLDLSEEELEMAKEMMTLPTVPVSGIYDDEGNAKHVHTQQEIVEEFAGEDGLIYFSLEDGPIRNIVTDEELNINNVVNYGDAYINILEEEAYVIEDESELELAYDIFLQAQPEELTGEDVEYRSFEEATNLEKGIIQIAHLTGGLVNDLGFLVEQGALDHELVPLIQAEFERLGSPNVLMPTPQTPNDMGLYEVMVSMQTMWGELGQFEDPIGRAEEFEELYNTLRQETNNLFARINYTLSEDIF